MPGSLDADPNKPRDRSQCRFRPDERIHETYRATNENYHRSGFHRGHLAAAGNYLSQKLMEETFLLTNVSPQDGGLNNGAWNRLEEHVRWVTLHLPETTILQTEGGFVPSEETALKRTFCVIKHFFDLGGTL